MAINLKKKFPIKDNNGNTLYDEFISNYNGELLYIKYEYNPYGKRTYYEKGRADGTILSWVKFQYNDNNDMTYWIDSDNEWAKWEYDGHKLIYHESSDYGVEIDERPTIALSLEEIAERLGIASNKLLIKK
jgi:hypothetical protein